MNASRHPLIVLTLLLSVGDIAWAEDGAAITPNEKLSLFNGRDLTGLSTWLEQTKGDDPQRVFRVTEGNLHLSGAGNGYLVTKQAYRDYHLTVEYKWGQRTDGGKFVRNSGILLHATGPAGGAGAWPSCIECQLAQGCVGDLILIRGKDAAGKEVPVSVTAETELAPDKRRRRWHAGGEKSTFPPARGQLWWSRHDWDFEELLDTRGKHDVESKLSDWTRVECLVKGSEITIKVNGHTVNHVTDVFPAAGQIALQTEGFEIIFRKFEIAPLK